MLKTLPIIGLGVAFVPLDLLDTVEESDC